MSAKREKLSKAINVINKVKTANDNSKSKKRSPNKKSSSDSEDDLQLNGFNVQTSNKELTYEKLELHAQILLRPDTYIGSIKNVKSIDPVFIFDNNKIVKSQIAYPDGLIRIFVEVLSNAIDNVWQSIRSNITPKIIKVYIDRETNTISVWNDGRNIPTKLHEKENIHIPELIFGHLLTSSNYNDAEERKTSGRNGYGVKLCNIFSSFFPLIFITLKMQFIIINNGLIICINVKMLS